MSYINCNCCPTPWECGTMQVCYNARVIQQQRELIHAQERIKGALATYDASRAALHASWGPPPVKQLDAKPICPHNERSVVGICLQCGNW